MIFSYVEVCSSYVLAFKRIFSLDVLIKMVLMKKISVLHVYCNCARTKNRPNGEIRDDLFPRLKKSASILFSQLCLALACSTETEWEAEGVPTCGRHSEYL